MIINPITRLNQKVAIHVKGKGPVTPPERCWNVPWAVGRRGRILATLITAHKMANKIENSGVALAAHRWGRRCFSVGLTVASGTERWFSDDASVDKAAFCACGRWFGGGLTLVKRNTAFDYGAERIASSDKWLKDTTSVFSIFLL